MPDTLRTKHLTCERFLKKPCHCTLQKHSFYPDCFLKGIWHCYWEYDHLKGIPGSDLTVYDIGFQTDFRVYLQLRQTWLAFSKCPLNLVSLNGHSGQSISVSLHFSVLLNTLLCMLLRDVSRILFVFCKNLLFCKE